MAVNDSDKKTRAISEQRVEKGKELGQFQEAQGQLLNVQAEQRNNLNEARVVSEMEQQNNQTLAQAAGMLAASGGGAAAGVVAAQPQLNPGTKAILSKYGMGGKPGTQTRTVHTTQQSQTPQKISITNNTTTTNNNNVQVSQPSIPMSAPVIPMRAAQQSGDINKFKVWISNTFARQNEAAAIREKEYRRREWSLTRSANKMIRKMGEIGKSIGERMSPKNFGNILGDQLKVVFGLMGLHWVSENVGNILDKVSDVVGYFTGKTKSGVKIKEPKFVSDIKGAFISFLGGKKGETVFDALKGLINDFSVRLRGELELLFDSRSRAIKQLEFPEIDLKKMNSMGIITTVGKYLGDVISVALGGPKALEKSKLRELTQKARQNSIETYEDDYSHTQDATSILGTRSGTYRENTSIGDAVMYDSTFRKNFKMSNLDYNLSGGLSNNVSASIKQSQYLYNQMDQMLSTGNINTTVINAGLSSLRSAAKKSDGTLVSGPFLDKLGIVLGIPVEMDKIKRTLKRVRVRYIIVAKTEQELQQENAGSFLGNAMESYLTDRMMSTVGGGTLSYAGSIAKSFEKGNWGEGTTKILLGWTGGMRAGIDATFAKTRNSAHDDYTIKMVREDDPKYPLDKFPIAYGPDGNPLVDNNNNIYYLLNKAGIDAIDNLMKLKVNEDFELGKESVKNLQYLDNLCQKYIKKHSPTGVRPVSDLAEYDTTLKVIENLTEQDNKERAQFKESNKNDRVSTSGIRLKIAGEDLRERLFGSSDSMTVRSITSQYQNQEDSQTTIKGKQITDGESRRNAMYVMDRLINDEDLALTPSQAAGIVGNLMAESKLNPSAVNPNGGAEGIAQWLGERKKFFMEGEAATKIEHPKSDVKEVIKDNSGEVISKWVPKHKSISDSTLHEQVEFLVHELKTTHNSAIQRLKGLGNNASTSDAADIGLHSFEFRTGSLKGVEEEFAKHGQEGQAHINTRRQHSADVLKTWNNASTDEKSSWSKPLLESLTGNTELPPVDEFLGKFNPLRPHLEKRHLENKNFSINPEDFVEFDENGKLKKVLNPLYDTRNTQEKVLDAFNNDETMKHLYNLKLRAGDSDLELISLLKDYNYIDRDLNDTELFRFYKGSEYFTDILKQRKYKDWEDKELSDLAKILKIKPKSEKREDLIKAIDEFAIEFSNSKFNQSLFDYVSDETAAVLYKSIPTDYHGNIKYNKIPRLGSAITNMTKKDLSGSSSSTGNVYAATAAFKRNQEIDETIGNVSKYKKVFGKAKYSEEIGLKMDEIAKTNLRESMIDTISKNIKEQEEKRLLENYLEKNGAVLKNENGDYDLNPIKEILSGAIIQKSINLPGDGGTEFFEIYNDDPSKKNIVDIIKQFGGIKKVKEIINGNASPEQISLASKLITASAIGKAGISSEDYEKLADLKYSENFYKLLTTKDDSTVDYEQSMNNLRMGKSQAFLNLAKYKDGEHWQKAIIDKLFEISKDGRGLDSLLLDDIKIGDKVLDKQIVKDILIDWRNSDTGKNIELETKNQIAQEMSANTLFPASTEMNAPEMISISPEEIREKGAAVVEKLTNSKYLNLDGSKLLSQTLADKLNSQNLLEANKTNNKVNLNILEVLNTMAHNDMITGYYNQVATQALISLANKPENKGGINIFNNVTSDKNSVSDGLFTD